MIGAPSAVRRWLEGARFALILVALLEHAIGPAASQAVPGVPGQGAGQIPRLIHDLVQRHGFEGFCVLEPHLTVSELMYGFTGPERFGDAAVALQGELDRRQIAYA